MNNVIAIGIVNYNGGGSLRKCVASALSLKNAAVTVYVYDNASTDGSMESIADLEPVVRLHGTENRGYAFACNRLIATMDGAIVAIANMDLEFEPAWAEQVCAALARFPEADAVASVVLEQGNPVTVNFAGIGFFPDLHPQSIYAGARPEEVPSVPSFIFGAYGAVMAFRKTLFDITGLFDEAYFLFYEETEFFWRMNLYGRKTVFWPQARVLHYRSLTTTRFSPLKLFYSERNRIYTGLKILPLRRYPGLFVWSLYRLILMRRRADVSQKAKMRTAGASAVRVLYTIASAWAAAIRRFPSIWFKRRQLWLRSGATPRDTVRILERYRIPWQSLSLK